MIDCNVKMLLSDKSKWLFRNPPKQNDWFDQYTIDRGRVPLDLCGDEEEHVLRKTRVRSKKGAHVRPWL